jgi:hypothetical protein
MLSQTRNLGKIRVQSSLLGVFLACICLRLALLLPCCQSAALPQKLLAFCFSTFHILFGFPFRTQYLSFKEQTLMPHDDWSSKTKRLIFNLFMIALLVIAIIKVLLVEISGLSK